MIAVDVPPGVLDPAIVARAVRVGGEAGLYAEERALLVKAVPRRVAEFTAGRAAARLALAALGMGACAVPSGPDRVPRFPDGVVGSLSHSRSVAFAAVARRSDFAAIGVDVEEDDPLRTELIDLITTPGERSAAPPDRGRWAKVVFSAKEAVFKCWYTAGGGRLTEFSEFELEVGRDVVRILRMPDPVIPIRARWVQAAGAVWVVAAVPTRA